MIHKFASNLPYSPRDLGYCYMKGRRQGVTDQETFEENKEHSRISEDHPNSVFVQESQKTKHILLFFQ